MARDYAKEYRNYDSKPEQKKRRAERNAARKKLEKEKRDDGAWVTDDGDEDESFRRKHRQKQR